MDTVEKRVERAEALISMGEISVARHALEGSPVAPGNEDTLNALRDEDRRHPVPRDPIPEEILRAVPTRPFQLDTVFADGTSWSSRGAHRHEDRTSASSPEQQLDNEERGLEKKSFELLLEDWEALG